jgi:phospholipid-translocating ATPase
LVSSLTTEQAAKESLMLQIANGSQMIKLEKDPDAAFALVIDGKALTFVLEDDMKHMFLNLAIECASVICCRVSPKQKALVTLTVSLCTIIVIKTCYIKQC